MTQMKSIVRFCRCIYSYFLFLSQLMCFCGIAFYSSVCGSLGCCWFTVLCHVSLESLLREGEMFLKTFIINQRNHLRGMPFLYLKFNGWSSLQPLPGVLYMFLFCHLIQWTDMFSVLSSSSALCHHLYTTATGEDDKDRRPELIIYFFHAVESKALGGYFTGVVLFWEPREKELRVWKRNASLDRFGRRVLVGGSFF